jgi:branched-chain amino acid transport system ATP-binding protein
VRLPWSRSLLLLDEPVAGMTGEEIEDMARFVLDVREELDVTMILVEHHMGVVMDLADRVMVVDFGKSDRARSHRRTCNATLRSSRAYLGEGDSGPTLDDAAAEADAIAAAEGHDPSATTATEEVSS